MNNKSIYIYCDYIQPGGVERVSIRLRDLFKGHGYDSVLVSADGSLVFHVETEPVFALKMSRDVLIFSRIKDILKLKFKLYSNYLIYWRHLPINKQNVIRRSYEIIFIILMSYFGKVTCVCEELKKEISSISLVKKSNVLTCYSPANIVISESIKIQGICHRKKIRLLYFGREGKQKKFYEAISLIKLAKSNGINICLHVYGYSKAPLIYKDETFIKFHKVTESPIDTMKQYDGLLLISRYEGFPTVFVEAAICGLPIFCNQFRTGLNDFIKIIGPVNILNTQHRDPLGHAVKNVIKGHYDLNALCDHKLMRQWSNVL